MQPKRFPITSWMNYKWDVVPEEMVEEWRDIGFTLTMTPPVNDDPRTHELVRRLLDLCAEAGIEAIVCDARTHVPGGNWGNPSQRVSLPEDYRERAAAAVREWGGHPAVWGFHVNDEPLCGGLPAVAEACRILRELTDREPYFNLMSNHLIDPDGTTRTIEWQIGFNNFAAYLDHVVKESDAAMLSYDQYCSMSEEWGGPDHYYRCLADYQAAAIRHNIPFWNIILAHGHWMYKAPTPLQMSWQFYSSLAYGAQGIMYFMYRAGGIGDYGAPVDELGNRGPLFHQLQRQHNQFLGQWAWRYRDCTPVATYHWPAAPAGLKTLDGSGIVRSVTEDPSTTHRHTPPSDLIIGEMRDRRGRPHVLIANGSAEKHTKFRVDLNGRSVHCIRDEGKEERWGRPVAGGGCECGEFLMPGQAIFLRVET